MKSAFLVTALVLAIWFGLSCGGSSQTYSIRGYVILLGTETDSNGDATGQIAVTDADGVRADLLNSALNLVSTTHTDGGRYMFMDLASGEYRVATSVSDISGDTTSAMTVSEGDIEALDTLSLRSSDFLLAYENPFDDAVTLRFTQTVEDSATLDILGPDESVVRNLKSQVLSQGEYSIVWNGARDDTSSAPPGPYWAVYRSGSISGNELLIKSQ